MTQMLLFDAPVGIADSALLPVADFGGADFGGADFGDAGFGSVAESTAAPGSSDSATCCGPGEGATDGGLHHMGDLARLVLLRYDLLAKRRAHYAARRRAR